MLEWNLKWAPVFAVVCLTLFARLSADSDYDWDIQDPNLTEEIEKLTQRPEPYRRTPSGVFHFTELTPPEAYYEAEYADKPCQDKAEGKILAKASNKNVLRKNNKEGVVVDHLKVSKENGGFKVQQNLIIPKEMEAADDGKVESDDALKYAPIGDNVQNDETQVNLKNIEDGKNIPIGDKLNEDVDNKPKEINAVDAGEQVNMKDVVNDVKEETIDEKKKQDDQKLYAIVNQLKEIPNMKQLYNIAEEPSPNGQPVVKAHHSLHEKTNQLQNREKIQNEANNKIDLTGGLINEVEKIKRNNGVNKNSINDIQIKIKLERFDNAKSNLNKQVNSLFDVGKRSLSGLSQFQSLVDKVIPLAQDGMNNQNSNLKPQNFYMKYLQIDPSRHELRYEYYFFQKYVNSRYGSGKESSANSQPTSLLFSKLLSQMLSPSSLLSAPLGGLSSLFAPKSLCLLNPLSFNAPLNSAVKLPVKIFMNAKSAAKYEQNLNAAQKQEVAQNPEESLRLKREATTTERPVFNEGPFKVEDPAHLKWAKEFLRSFPEDKRPTTCHVIHQQPTSTDIYQWYHPFPGEEATYYTIEPVPTRPTNPGEPVDLCKCHDFKKPIPKEEDCIYDPADYTHLTEQTLRK